MKRTLIALYGHGMAALLFALWGVLKLTVRVRHVNRPPHFAQQHTIDCAWHEGLMPYFAGAMRYPKPYVWMNHPAWYMRGVHIYLGWMGVHQLVLGSSGHGGRRALQALAPLLTAGASTFLNPDGPYGPAHQVKDGVLDLALLTGAPIVAIHVRCHCAWRAPTWDRKLIPWPGSLVELVYSPPWQATAENREALRAMIQSHLNG